MRDGNKGVEEGVLRLCQPNQMSVKAGRFFRCTEVIDKIVEGLGGIV